MTESTEPMPEPLSEASAADIAEQHRSVVPDDAESRAPRTATAASDADEADTWEQGQDVPVDDDDVEPSAG